MDKAENLSGLDEFLLLLLLAGALASVFVLLYK
jgi:hypothetical protein